MKAISLWQPFASLISGGLKSFETRHFPPPASLLGKRIAIHAAKRHHKREEREWWVDTVAYLRHMAGDDEFSDAAYMLDKLVGWKVQFHAGNPIPRGAIVCTAVLDGAYQCGDHVMMRGRPMWSAAKVMPGSRSINTYTTVDPYGDYSPGRWAWRLDDVKVLDVPIPAVGKQGWFDWDPNAVRAEHLTITVSNQTA